MTEAGPDEARALPPAAPRGQPVTIDFEGSAVRGFAGEPVAVALFAAEVRTLARSPKYHRPRGFFCLDGHCGSCLMRIDGRPNRRACLVPVRAGLRCERQNAFPDADVDLLRAADWLFPGGMDHHRLMTGSRVGNELFLKVVREMGGSGLLPDAPADPVPPARDEAVDLCVVGAGPAGVTVWPGATAIARYPEDGDPPGVLAVVTAAGLVRVRARRTLYATGSYDQNLPFPDSDRPGVVSARACGRLVFRWGVRPGRRVIIVGDPEAARPFTALLQQRLEALGIPVVLATSDRLPRVDAKRDLVAVDTLPAPASELPRQHGARVRLVPESGGFVPEMDAAHRGAEAVYVAGDVTGYRGPAAAAADGAAAGADAVGDL